MTTHALSTKHPCPYCQRVFTEKSLLLDHIKWHIEDNETKFRCAICQKVLESKWRLNVHMMSHNKQRLDKSKAFKRKDHWKEHTQRQSGARTFQCPKSPSVSSQSQDFRRHTDDHHHKDKNTMEASGCSIQEGENTQFDSESNRGVVEEKNQLESHEMMVHIERSFACVYCTKAFRQEADLKEHTNIHTVHDYQNNEMDLQEVKENVKGKTQEPVFEDSSNVLCTEQPGGELGPDTTLFMNPKATSPCPSSPSREIGDSVEGQSGMQAVQSYKCKKCNINFHLQQDLIVHMKIHSIAPHQCPHCSRSLRSKDDLHNHIEWHKQEHSPKFQCKVCLKVWESEVKLQRHMICHRSEKPFQCSICENVYKRASHLKEHRILYHSEKPFKCSSCPESFFRLQHLKSHTRQIHTSRPSRQQQRPKALKKKTSMPHHKELHSEQNGPKRVCESKSPSESQTIRDSSEKVWEDEEKALKHMVTEAQSGHRGKRSYQCNYCDKAFKQISHLKEHEMIHTGEKPFLCSVCPKGFIRARDLVKHKDIHLKRSAKIGQGKERKRSRTKKSFQCYLCPETFFGSQGLKRHITLNHTSTPSRQHQRPIALKEKTSLPHHTELHKEQNGPKLVSESKSPSESQTIRDSSEKVWEDEEKVLKHMSGHRDSSERSFNDANCIEEYRHEADLKEHMNIHTINDNQHREIESQGLDEQVKDKTQEPVPENSSRVLDIEQPGSEEGPDSTLFMSPNVISPCPLSPSREIGDSVEGQSGMQVVQSYKCKVCMKKFHLQQHLNEHIKIHSTAQHPCPHCPRLFRSKHDLHNHIEWHKEEHSPKFHCYICLKVWESEMKLQRHMVWHRSERPFQCSICEKAFKRASHLKNHMISKHSEKPFKCSLCPKSFSHSQYLESHTRQIHERSSLPHKEESNNEKVLESESQSKSEKNRVNRHICPLCAKTYSTLSYLRVHIDRHLNKNECSTSRSESDHAVDGAKSDVIDGVKKPSLCSASGKSFGNKSNFVLHWDLQHAIEKKYSCPICSYQTSSKCNLGVHMTRHTGQKDWLCEVCSKAFYTKSEMQLHQEIHITDPSAYKWQCDVCSKYFPTARKFKVHVRRRHKPNSNVFACDKCDYRTGEAGNLRKHERIHTGVRPYSCQTCQKAFALPGTLKAHERIHEGEKPYQCDQCHKSFTQHGGLYLHRKKWHPAKE